MTKRSYYLLMDGKTITTEKPTVTYKSVARAASKGEAQKTFKARFETGPGRVYTERKPGATPRRVTIARPFPDRRSPMEEGQGPKAQQHLQLPPSAEGARTAGLQEEEDLTLDIPREETARLLGLGPLVQTFHYRSVTYKVPQGSIVTLTSRGEIILTPAELAPDALRENLTDLFLAGMRE